MTYSRHDDDGHIISRNLETQLTGHMGRAKMMLGKDFVDKPVHLSANRMAPLKITKFLPVKAQLFLVLEGKEGAASFNSNHKNENSLPISPRADDGKNPSPFNVVWEARPGGS